jgi:hypothetical protein
LEKKNKKKNKKKIKISPEAIRKFPWKIRKKSREIQMKPKKSNCQTGRNHILIKRETTSAHPKLRKYVYTNFYYY